MEFLIDFKKKRSLLKMYICGNKYLRKIHKKFGLLSLLLFILAATNVVYACIDGWQINHILSISLITVIDVGLGICFKVLTIMNLNKDLRRVDEKITIQDGVLIYSYRLRTEQSSSDRIRIYMTLDKIQNIEYNTNTKEIKVFGEFQKQFVEHISPVYRLHDGNIVRDEKINSFIFYDYFEPNLYQHLWRALNK